MGALATTAALRWPALPVAAAVACAVVALAVWPGPAVEAPEDATLTIGVGRDLYDGPDSRTFVHGSTHSWEALTILDESLRARPWLAESWHSEDSARTWVFTLRHGVVFHDGTPMTAADAVAAIERIRSRPKLDPAGVFRSLESVTARGDHELVMRFARPAPAAPSLVAYYSSPILKPSTFGEDGRLTSLVGTGPFRLVRALPGEAVELEAFPGYWGPRPAYRRVVFRTVLDAQTRLLALLAGDLDAVADVGAILPDQVDAIKGRPDITLERVEVATTHYLLFSCRREPFSEASSRLWLAGMVDRDALVAAFAPGAGIVARDPYSRLASSWAFGLVELHPGQAPGALDRELVILLHAGTLQRWPYLEIAQVLQERLRSAGAASRIVTREAGAYYEGLRSGRFDLAIQPSTLMTGDPDFFYASYLESGGTMDCGCGSSDLDRLIATGRGAVEPERRREIYRELELLLSRHLPVLPLYHDVALYAHGPTVESFSMDASFRPSLVEARPVPSP
jgi:peptide/nickel transport system substrate-binding protein